MTQSSDSTDGLQNGSESEQSDSSGRLKKLKPTGWFGNHFPYVWFVGLLGLLLGGVALAVRGGYVAPSVTVQATVNLGWAVEAVVGVLVGTFAVFNLIMLARLAGVGFINSVIDVVTRAMDGYSRDDL
jgi:hypothetical protein